MYMTTRRPPFGSEKYTQKNSVPRRSSEPVRHVDLSGKSSAAERRKSESALKSKHQSHMQNRSIETPCRIRRTPSTPERRFNVQQDLLQRREPSSAPRFKPNDVVRIESDIKRLKDAQEEIFSWNDKMKKVGPNLSSFDDMSRNIMSNNLPGSNTL